MKYLNNETELLRRQVILFYNSPPTYTVDSKNFYQNEQYLFIPFDMSAIYDFQKAVIDFANGMNQFVQVCNEITEQEKILFAQETDRILKKYSSAKSNLKDRYYISPWSRMFLLGGLEIKNLAQTSEDFKREIETKTNFTGEISPGMREFSFKMQPISGHFDTIFNPRVQIPDNYEIFFKGDFKGFNDSSDETLSSWWINQIEGIINYCESKGIKFDEAKMEAWRKTFPENFKPEPVKFSGPGNFAPLESKGLRPIIKFLIVLGILALLSAAIIGFILYKRNKKEEI